MSRIEKTEEEPKLIDRILFHARKRVGYAVAREERKKKFEGAKKLFRKMAKNGGARNVSRE